MSDAKTSEFTIKIHTEPDHFWAEVVELPGCFATGYDLEELRECLEEGISLYLYDTVKAGTLSPINFGEEAQVINGRVEMALA